MRGNYLVQIFFDTVAMRPGEKIIPFLSGLAKQRGLVISSSSQGELLFLKATETGEPVANLIEGLSPLLSIAPIFSPQDYYSIYNVIQIGLAHMFYQ